MVPVIPAASIGVSIPPGSEPALRQAARDLEAAFLAEMLKFAGVGESPDAFGGGAGEEQFCSLLVDAQARAIAENGGIGLAESIFEALKVTQHV